MVALGTQELGSGFRSLDRESGRVACGEFARDEALEESERLASLVEITGIRECDTTVGFSRLSVPDGAAKCDGGRVRLATPFMVFTFESAKSLWARLCTLFSRGELGSMSSRAGATPRYQAVGEEGDTSASVEGRRGRVSVGGYKLESEVRRTAARGIPYAISCGSNPVATISPNSGRLDCGRAGSGSVDWAAGRERLVIDLDAWDVLPDAARDLVSLAAFGAGSLNFSSPATGRVLGGDFCCEGTLLAGGSPVVRAEEARRFFVTVVVVEGVFFVTVVRGMGLVLAGLVLALFVSNRFTISFTLPACGDFPYLSAGGDGFDAFEAVPSSVPSEAARFDGLTAFRDVVGVT